ncbi:hypothetical protein PCANC_28863 [Puccinia coronata f. sp. avenae]|uniref:No apical meristem-associated C-terminal domain-containing protein n=1 Tax=Puccinia coronata f. sp. avenae TaxID=200324 RepID=A0A2N5RUC9_9BASI|nr:hypothetical protein PCANC_28863 [Puccinia coronata f. sp. avenae]
MKRRPKKPPNWHIEEDQSLCTSSWINTSKYATGTLKNRWHHIQHQVNKYCGYYLQVKRRLRSGSTKDVVTVEAKVLFKTNTGKSYNLDHCWGILHHLPQWVKNMNKINGRAKPKTPKDTANEVTPATAKVPSSSAATEDSSVHLECCQP